MEKPAGEKMKNQKTLKVTINFRDKTSKSIEKNVMVGEKIDMNILHHSIMTIQKETNEILTTIVENEKQTPVSGQTTTSGKCFFAKQVWLQIITEIFRCCFT